MALGNDYDDDDVDDDYDNGDYDDNNDDENDDDDDDDDDERVVECGSGLDKEHLLEATQGWRPTIRGNPSSLFVEGCCTATDCCSAVAVLFFALH